MGGTTQSKNSTNQEFIKTTIMDTLNEKNISNIMESNVKNNQECSASSSNLVSIGSGNTTKGGRKVTYGDITSEQNSTVNLSCLAKAEMFAKVENDIASKIVSDLKNKSETDIKNLLDNKTTSELGNMGKTSSTTDSSIKTNDTTINKVTDKLNLTLKNILNNENTKTCKASVSNEFLMESNNKDDGYVEIDVKKLKVIQTTSAFANCIFSDSVKNEIATKIATDLSSKLDNTTTTKSSTTQTSTTESKSVGSIIKNILEGIGGIISSSMGIFIIFGIIAVVGLGLFFYFGGADIISDATNTGDKNNYKKNNMRQGSKSTSNQNQIKKRN